ncbi:hypothetical protein NR798_45355 [Archangium gephyra]|uniref:hypothetical protein n=1 Tax=Archangium gephyra TaxID=48 RepID=UPI0035D522D2
MSLAITSQSSMKTQDANTQVGIPQFNAFDVNVVYQEQLILKNGSGVITFLDGATQIDLFGFGNDKLPEIGAVVKIWGVSKEHGNFRLLSARCSAHGERILKGSATFIQLVVPEELEGVGIPQPNADANVASEFGLLLLKDGGAVLTSNLGATSITVFGFKKDSLPAVGAVMKIWGVSYDQGPYFLPNAKCMSHGTGVLEGSATFLQVIAPSVDEAGIPRYNAFDLNVTRDGQSLLQDGKGVITFLFGGTELTAYGFEEDKLPAIGSIVTIWGVSLERGHFALSSAKCTAHGSGLLKGSATFAQMLVGPTGK